VSPPERSTWDRYVEQFHDNRPGITETVLGAGRARGSTPYEWLAAAVDDPGGTLLDLACGSAPLAPLVGADRWIGLDRSDAELRTAQHRHPDGTLVRADASRLPLRDRSVESVACSLALMALPSLELVVDELARVTRVGGRLALLLPTGAPLSLRDRGRYARLSLTLRARPDQFPNPVAMRDTARLLAAGGYTVTRDERIRFAYRITDEAGADALVDSFYLPGVTPERLLAARLVVRRWRGTDIGIPLRRIVATGSRLDDSG
jgi:SAM-dependent methyltransferase